MIFRFKTNHKLIGISGTGVWIIGLVILILSGIGVGKHFESFNSVNKDYAVDLQKGKTIILKMNDKPDFFAFDEVRRFDDFYLVSDAGHNRVYGQPELKIVNSEDSAIMLSVEYKSRGRSKRDALRKSEAISYDWIATDSTISLNHYFSLPDNEKYFAQDVELTLAVPEGIRLFVETEAGEIIHYIKNKNNLWTNELLDKTWLMTSEGLDSIR